MPSPNVTRLMSVLASGDFRYKTSAEIAHLLGTSPEAVESACSLLAAYGVKVEYFDPKTRKPTTPCQPKPKQKDLTQIVHGKCEKCFWFSANGPCCDYNMEHFTVNPGEPRLRHGPIDADHGGCDCFDGEKRRGQSLRAVKGRKA